MSPDPAALSSDRRGRPPRAAFVSLGSNMQPEAHLIRAVKALEDVGRVRRVSNVYESEAVGPPGQPIFLNAVVRVDVDLDAGRLRERLRQMEAELGRVRTADKYAPRPIDLDLVAMDDYLDSEVATRAYLAVTLSEIAPDLAVGDSGESISAVAARLRPTARLRLRSDLDLSDSRSLTP